MRNVPPRNDGDIEETVPPSATIGGLMRMAVAHPSVAQYTRLVRVKNASQELKEARKTVKK